MHLVPSALSAWPKPIPSHAIAPTPNKTGNFERKDSKISVSWVGESICHSHGNLPQLLRFAPLPPVPSKQHTCSSALGTPKESWLNRPNKWLKISTPAPVPVIPSALELTHGGKFMFFLYFLRMKRKQEERSPTFQRASPKEVSQGRKNQSIR